MVASASTKADSVVVRCRYPSPVEGCRLSKQGLTQVHHLVMVSTRPRTSVIRSAKRQDQTRFTSVRVQNFSRHTFTPFLVLGTIPLTETSMNHPIPPSGMSDWIMTVSFPARRRLFIKFSRFQRKSQILLGRTEGNCRGLNPQSSLYPNWFQLHQLNSDHRGPAVDLRVCQGHRADVVAALHRASRPRRITEYSSNQPHLHRQVSLHYLCS